MSAIIARDRAAGHVQHGRVFLPIQGADQAFEQRQIHFRGDLTRAPRFRVIHLKQGLHQTQHLALPAHNGPVQGDGLFNGKIA